MKGRFDRIAVIDFGSQYTQLIARRIREEGVYAEILSCETPIEELREFGAAGIILSGGPSSVREEKAPTYDPAIFELGIPILGICYGMQLISYLMGGKVQPGDASE